MTDCKRMYHALFNAVTDALNLMREGQISEARYILKQAQLLAEEIDINTCGGEES